MTSRLFLTLLAILTGLSVQTTSAEARTIRASSAEIGALAVNCVGGKVSISADLAGVETQRPGPAGLLVRLFPAQSISWHVKTVLTGVDRARE